MKTSILFALLMRLAAFFLIPCLLLAQQAQPTFFPQDIPSALLTSDMRGTLQRGFQTGRVSANASERTVYVHWTASALQNRAPDYSLAWDPERGTLGTASFSTDRQAHVVAFYPTAIGRLSGDSILVAGAKTNGGTIIQKWTVLWPSEMPAPVVGDDGFSSVSLVLPTVQKSVVYSTSGLGSPGFVSGMCGLRSPVGVSDALVQYLDPNNVYVMSLTSGAMTLVASETGTSGTIGAIAALGAKDYSGIGSSERAGFGYVYQFYRGRTDVLSSSLDVPVLMIIDSDKDGSIDGHLELSSGAYESTGWATLDNYVSPWLD
jgi:hypothetical protein